MKKIAIIGLLALSVAALAGCGLQNVNQRQAAKEPVKIGFIGAMTGQFTKYGSYQAVQLAIDDINKNGGINGAQVKLIAEDGKCDPSTAVTAMNKLIDVDQVKVVLGGHCTPESNAIAPVAEINKVIMLAAISASPALTNMGDYIFRTSPVATVQSTMDATLAYNKLGLRKMAIIYEQTDYARPIAEKMKEEFSRLGGKVAVYESYNPGVIDFRTILTKAKDNQVDSIFISPQSPDAGFNLMKQIREMKIKAALFGNDVAGIQANIDKDPAMYEGFILSSPDFNPENPKTKDFIDEYNSKYNTKDLPYGFWTAESYDGAMLIADAIAKNGLDVEKIKQYLYNVKNYEGVSGKISIDSNGDGIREYVTKVVKNGKMVNY